MNRRPVRRLTETAVLAALLAVTAPIAIPLGPVPVTLATLVIAVGAVKTGSAVAVTAVAVYLGLGALGLPVFSGFAGGIGHFTGPTGGFLAGYLPFALICGLSNKKKIVPRIVLFLCATLVLYFTGTVWYVFWADVPSIAAVSACVMPTIPGDVLKIVAATVIAKRVGDAP